MPETPSTAPETSQLRQAVPRIPLELINQDVAPPNVELSVTNRVINAEELNIDVAGQFVGRIVEFTSRSQRSPAEVAPTPVPEVASTPATAVPLSPAVEVGRLGRRLQFPELEFPPKAWGDKTLHNIVDPALMTK